MFPGEPPSLSETAYRASKRLHEGPVVEKSQVPFDICPDVLAASGTTGAQRLLRHPDSISRLASAHDGGVTDHGFDRDPFDVEHSAAGAYEMLGRLNRLRQADPAAIARQDDSSVTVLLRRSHRPVFVEVAVVKTVRQADEVRGVPVAAHMCGLPHIAEPLVEEARQRRADPRAAGTVPAVGAHEQDRSGDGHAEPRGAAGRDGLQVEPVELLRILDLAPLQPRARAAGSGAGVAGEARVDQKGWRRPPSPRGADQLRPYAVPPGARDGLGDWRGQRHRVDVITPRAGMLDEQPAARARGRAGQARTPRGVAPGAVRAAVVRQRAPFHGAIR